MKDLIRLRADTLPRWRELTSGAVESIDALVESFIEQVMAVPPYGDGVVTREDLVQAAHESLSLIVRTISEGRNVDDLGALPATLGRRRARQGIPPDSLARAVRIDFTLLWSYLLWRAQGRDALTLALHVDELWSVVDTYARGVHQAYLEEVALIVREEQDHQRRFLIELFRPSSYLRVGQIAVALDTDETATYRVAVSTLAGAELVYRAQANLRAAGAVVFVVEWNGAVIAFWPSSRRSSDVADELQYRWLAEGRLGFVPDVAGLAEVPAAAESAFDIAQAMRSDQSGLVTFTAVWERMAKQKLENSSTLLQQIIGGLDDCPDDERERLTETVHSYLVEGNVAAVAAQLYCHRNTIVKRLQRFQALTGLDVNRPRDAALALLALS